jgi:hypothetical protein
MKEPEPRDPGNKGTGPVDASPPTLGKHRGLVVVLLAAAVATAPQLIRGNSCGHDFDVHLVSWLDCVNAWRHGILYPHWTPSPNYDAGEPRFVFYPPLTWMLGAALGIILPWTLAPIALTFLTLAGTGFATRALALEALDEFPATLAGCVALFSGFTLFTAYERSAFPEFAGGVWLPLLLLFALGDQSATPHPIFSRFLRKGGTPQTRGETTQINLIRRAFDGSLAPLAVVFAASWLSNLPLAVIASYLLAGVSLLAAIAKRSWIPVLRAAIAAPLGLGLAAIYWIPAAFERNWVDIRQATEDPGYNFEHNWLFVHNANPILALHDAINHQVSWIAISMIAVAVVALFVCWLRGTLPIQKTTGSRRWWIPLAAIPVVVLFLSFPISRPVWVALPEMRFLQYPWRWQEAVEAPMAIFFVAAVWPARRPVRIAVLAVCASWFIAATVFAGKVFFQVCHPEDTAASTLADFRNGAGFEGMYEYEPPGADLTLIARGLPDACLVTDPATEFGKPDPDDPDANPIWSASQGSCQATFSAMQDRTTGPENRRFHMTIFHPGFLVLRLLGYPAWNVQVNGHPLKGDRANPLPRRDDGLIAVPVPQGTTDVSVDWTTTPDVLASRWASGISLLLLIGVWLCELRLTRGRLR